MTVIMDTDGVIHLKFEGSANNHTWSYKTSSTSTWTPYTAGATVEITETKELSSPNNLKYTQAKVNNRSDRKQNFYASVDAASTITAAQVQSLNIDIGSETDLNLTVGQTVKDVTWHISTAADDPTFKIRYRPPKASS